MTKKIEPVIEPVELVEDEPIIEPIELVIDVAPVEDYTVVEGDTYPSIAAVLKPAGMTTHQYAQRLVELNSGSQLSAGVTIKL
jgi:hypothetical protein